MKKIKCEYCDLEISANNIKKHISIKHLGQIFNVDKIRCEYCDLEFSKYGIKNHIAIVHEGKIERVSHPGNLGKTAWNKGLTKLTDTRVNLISEKVSKTLSGKPGRKPTEIQKKQISNAMKKAHAEGRAWNIGKSRWNNEPSYPEKFFIEVIKNEFDDKNYVREFNVGLYSIDFAWVNKKLAIEIDGQQHEKEEYRLRDERKDKILIENGWIVLRLKWVDICNDTQNYIKMAKQFIDN